MSWTREDEENKQDAFPQMFWDCDKCGKAHCKTDTLYFYGNQYLCEDCFEAAMDDLRDECFIEKVSDTDLELHD